MSKVISSTKNTFVAEKTANDQRTDDVGADQDIDIVIIGNRFVGKTALLFKLTANQFTELYVPSIACDFRDMIKETHGGRKVRVKLWDTAGGGNEKAGKCIASSIYRNATGFIVVYDVTDIQSYNDVFHWMNTIEEHALCTVQVVIVGNKTDLMKDRKLSKMDGVKVASCYGAKYMEASVLKNRNLDKMLRRMVSNICDKSKKI